MFFSVHYVAERGRNLSGVVHSYHVIFRLREFLTVEDKLRQ